MRIRCPTGGVFPNIFRATSLPMKATRRCRRRSSASGNRPAATHWLRITAYSGETPRTM